MARTPEGRVKDAIKRYLNKVGAWWCMPATGGFGKSGVPDFLVCWKGVFIGIEAKAPGKAGNTTPAQNDQIAQIIAAGGVALVCDDVSVLANYFGEPHERAA